MSIRLKSTKTVAILQMLLGVLTIAASLYLVARRAALTAIIYTGPRESAPIFLELAPLWVSLAIFSCGLFQWALREKWGIWQAGSGLVNTIIAAFLIHRQNRYNTIIRSPVYYLAYLAAVLGMLIFATGFIQLTTKPTKSG